MTAILETLLRFPRSPRASRFLEYFGIDARHYWLLMDLFGLLTERGEMLDQLGRNGVALRTVTWTYAAFSAFLCVLMIAAQPPLAT